MKLTWKWSMCVTKWRKGCVKVKLAQVFFDVFFWLFVFIGRCRERKWQREKEQKRDNNPIDEWISTTSLALWHKRTKWNKKMIKIKNIPFDSTVFSLGLDFTKRSTKRSMKNCCQQEWTDACWSEYSQFPFESAHIFSALVRFSFECCHRLWITCFDVRSKSEESNEKKADKTKVVCLRLFMIFFYFSVFSFDCIWLILHHT